MIALLKWWSPLLMILSASIAFAGPSLTAGGLLHDAVDGTESVASVVRVFRTAAPGEVASLTSGDFAVKTWAGEVGAVYSEYQVGDELIAVAEGSENHGQLDHAGYYAVQATTLDGSDPAVFPEMILRPIPVPQISLQPGYVAYISWQEATEDGTGNIIGYRLWRSSDGTAFTEITSVDSATTTYQDANFPVDNRYYALSLIYRSDVEQVSPLLSANSIDSQDTDGDGFTDAEEVNCGSDPNIATDTCNRGMPWLMLLLEDE